MVSVQDVDRVELQGSGDMKWAAADEYRRVNLRHRLYLPGANSSCRMLSFLFKLIFCGVGFWVSTLPLAVAVAEPLRGRSFASLAISDGDPSAVIVRGESLPCPICWSLLKHHVRV